MVKILKFFTDLWKEIEPVVELFIYLGIAYGMSKLFCITFMQSIVIVFAWFVMAIARVIVENFRK